MKQMRKIKKKRETTYFKSKSVYPNILAWLENCPFETKSVGIETTFSFYVESNERTINMHVCYKFGQLCFESSATRQDKIDCKHKQNSKKSKPCFIYL